MIRPSRQGPGPGRESWLEDRRRIAVERYDGFATTYDRDWGAVSPTHAAMLERFLGRCSPGGLVLDAACGTGKYWPAIRTSGRRVVGLDQSAGMLARATTRFPDVPVERRALVDLEVVAAYDGIACIDAMEFVFPEDWPIVLEAFARALRPGAPLYLTVELAVAAEVEAAYRAALEDGLPVLPGEWLERGGYHYYPSRDQVDRWLAGAGLEILDEAIGDEYLHLVTRRSSRSPEAGAGRPR
jgi:SAM-dependent methyltransferase